MAWVVVVVMLLLQVVMVVVVVVLMLLVLVWVACCLTSTDSGVLRWALRQTTQRHFVCEGERAQHAPFATRRLRTPYLCRSGCPDSPQVSDKSARSCESLRATTLCSLPPCPRHPHTSPSRRLWASLPLRVCAPCALAQRVHCGAPTCGCVVKFHDFWSLRLTVMSDSLEKPQRIMLHPSYICCSSTAASASCPPPPPNRWSTSR